MTELRSWSPARIRDQSGRVVVITGANSGLGLETARALAQNGATVLMASRSADRGRAAVADIARSLPRPDVHLVQMDLADQASIEDAAGAILAQSDGIDLLINNAGVMATPRSTTADGHEMQFGTNHLGHFALTTRLFPAIESRAGRVVTISSLAARKGRIAFDDLDGSDHYEPWKAYRQSKLANLMFGIELAERCSTSGAATTSTIAHPGITATNLGSSLEAGQGLWGKIQAAAFALGGQSVEHGVNPTLAAALGPVESGMFVGPSGFGEMRGSGVAPATVTAPAQDRTVRAKLWARSEELTGLTFDPAPLQT